MGSAYNPAPPRAEGDVLLDDLRGTAGGGEDDGDDGEAEVGQGLGMCSEMCFAMCLEMCFRDVLFRAEMEWSCMSSLSKGHLSIAPLILSNSRVLNLFSSVTGEVVLAEEEECSRSRGSSSRQREDAWRYRGAHAT